ncbi:MAG: cryptochrome/photolyase family protein [Thiohalospira sp.]
MTGPTAIVWLRHDLRLADNPALAAATGYHRLIPLFIHEEPAPRPAGAAGRWWLEQSLTALHGELLRLGSGLVCQCGEPEAILARMAAEQGADVYWNRRYGPERDRDERIQTALRQAGRTVASFPGNLLFEPRTVATGSGTPYRVFTPYWKAVHPRLGEVAPQPAPAELPPLPAGIPADGPPAIADRHPWTGKLADHWQPGEVGARRRLDAFAGGPMADYPRTRDRPALEGGTSRLSPHLHFGEVTPRQVAALALACLDEGHPRDGIETFLQELVWREFAHHILFHFPATADEPMDPRFTDFPWRDAPEDLAAWQRCETGIPLVDAGMRELWATGWMHNRVRMVVASLLTKNLLLPWQRGAEWFEETLVDADLASNRLGWQWAAGSGADAAPYFRVFNPVRQAERFDPDGEYIARWVPELAALPGKWRRQPWAAPERTAREAGFTPGVTYPHPRVDLKASRERALAVWHQLPAFNR